MSNADLFDFAASVNSRQDFIEFVTRLNSDYREHQEEWQNRDLETFLDGLVGFTADMGGYYRNMGEEIDVDQITWRMAAQMLLAATVYGS